MILDSIFAVVFALVIHEAAHFVMAAIFGIRIKGLVLTWRGLGIVREPGAPFDNCMVSLAGPCANLLMAVCLWPNAPFWQYPFFLAQLIYGVVNLVPFGKSDGKRACMALEEIAVHACTK